MKEKKVYCLSIVAYLQYFISLVIFIAGIVGIIISIKNFQEEKLYNFVLFISSVAICIVMILLFYYTLRKKIRIGLLSVSVNSDLRIRGFFRRLQHAVEIKYEEIESLTLIKSTSDSLGKPLKFVFVPMLYIVFQLKNGNTSAINLYYFSRKQKIMIIDNIQAHISTIQGNKCPIFGQENL